MKIKPSERNYIELELYNRDYYAKELKLERERILESGPLPPDGQPRCNTTSDPTSRKALRLLMPSVTIMSLERSVRAIDETLTKLTDLHREVYDIVYRKRKNPSYAIYDELHTSERTFRRCKSDIIYKVGVEIGVIKLLA